MGFWVAATMNGSGSGRGRPSTLTCRSSIASSSAAWVFGGVRLISSASSRLVNTGPSRNANSALRASYTSEPVMSPGIRSGVNCTRFVSICSAFAKLRTSSVLAVPGTPSSSTCPRQSRAITKDVTAVSWPTTAFATSCRSAFRDLCAGETWPPGPEGGTGLVGGGYIGAWYVGAWFVGDWPVGGWYGDGWYVGGWVTVVVLPARVGRDPGRG